MNKRKNSKLGIVVFIILTAYFSYTVINQQAILERKNDEMKIAQAKIDEEKKLNAELKKQKSKIGSDEYIEDIARAELGMVKPGEKVFVDVNK